MATSAPFSWPPKPGSLNSWDCSAAVKSSGGSLPCDPQEAAFTADSSYCLLVGGVTCRTVQVADFAVTAYNLPCGASTAFCFGWRTPGFCIVQNNCGYGRKGAAAVGCPAPPCFGIFPQPSRR